MHRNQKNVGIYLNRIGIQKKNWRGIDYERQQQQQQIRNDRILPGILFLLLDQKKIEA